MNPLPPTKHRRHNVTVFLVKKDVDLKTLLYDKQILGKEIFWSTCGKLISGAYIPFWMAGHFKTKPRPRLFHASKYGISAVLAKVRDRIFLIYFGSKRPLSQFDIVEKRFGLNTALGIMGYVENDLEHDLEQFKRDINLFICDGGVRWPWRITRVDIGRKPELVKCVTVIPSKSMSVFGNWVTGGTGLSFYLMDYCREYFFSVELVYKIYLAMNSIIYDYKILCDMVSKYNKKGSIIDIEKLISKIPYGNE